MTPASEPATTESDLNLQLAAHFEILGGAIEDLLRQQAKEHGLSPLQIRILILLKSQPDALNASSLALALHLSKATISVALRPLEKKKMLLRKASEKDGRSTVLQLTDWGSQIAHVAGFYLEPLRRIIQSIPKSEKEGMLLNVKGILGKLEEGMK